MESGFSATIPGSSPGIGMRKVAPKASSATVPLLQSQGGALHGGSHL
jgi:hypothetical protein